MKRYGADSDRLSRIEVFFLRVQNILPLLHRPRILAEFLGSLDYSGRVIPEIDAESAILLNSMFALSARFSERDHLWKSSPKERGVSFARKANSLWRNKIGEDAEPTLRMLQSRILLAYYDFTSKPSFTAWQSTGACCRMAYSLSLHQIDRSSASVTDVLEQSDSNWVEQEERRRAWWACFQLDNVSSAIACRPLNIDSSTMEVRLPVSDDHWFAARYTESSLISPMGLSQVWRSLQDGPNQDAYAWFLVCNELLRSAYNLFAKRHRLMDDIKALQSALQCFALALPRSFRVTASNMTFDEHNYTEKNWVICTVVILQGYVSLKRIILL